MLASKDGGGHVPVTDIDQAAVFAALAPFAGGVNGSVQSYKAAAVALGITEGNFRVLLFRLRKRYRKLLRGEILETVNDPALVEGEIAELFAAVARP